MSFSGEGKACTSYAVPHLFSRTTSQNAFIQVAIHCSCDACAKQVVFVLPTKPADWNALTNTLNGTFSRKGKVGLLKCPRAIYGITNLRFASIAIFSISPCYLAVHSSLYANCNLLFINVYVYNYV